MANKVLEYLLTIKDEASATLEKFGKNLGSVSKSNTKDLASLAKGLGVISVGMTAVGVATLAVAKKTITMAGSFEQARKSFEVLTGSVEAGNILFDELKSFAKITPFNLDDILETTSMLLAMGSTTEGVVHEMEILGNASSAVNAPISRIAKNYAQVKNLTRLTARELNDFAINGIPLLDELSINLGKSKEEIMGMMSEGGVSFKMVEQAFESMSAEGGRFENLMKEMSKTTLGKVENMGDAFDQLKASIGDALLPSVNKLLNAVIPLIEKLTLWVAENPKLIKMLLALGAVIGVVGVALGIVAGLIAGFLIISAMAFSGVVFAIAGIALAIGALVAGIIIWKDEIWAFFTSLWEGISQIASTIWDTIKTVLTNIWTGITTFFTDLIASIAEYLMQIYENNKAWIDLTITIFTTFYNAIKWVFETIYTLISYVLQMIWAVIQAIWAKITEITTTIFNSIKDFLTKIWNFILNNVIIPVINKIKSVVQAGFELVKTYIINPITKAYDFVVEKFDAMYQKVVEIKEKIVEAFKSMAEGITNALKSIKFPHLSIGQGSTTVAGKEINYPKLNVDWYEKGGWVGNTGLAMVHEGEFVMSKDMLNGNKSVPQNVSNNYGSDQQVVVNATINTPIDAVNLGNILGQQLAFAGR